MLKVQETPDTNIVEVTVDGRITREDFDGVAVVLNKKIEKYGVVYVKFCKLVEA